MNEDSRRAWIADVIALVSTAGGLWACADVTGAREIAAAILLAQVLSSFGGRFWGAIALLLSLGVAAGCAWYGQPEIGVLSVLGGLAVHRRAVWASDRDDRLSLAIALLFVLFAILEDSPTLSRGAAVVAASGPWLLGAPALSTLPLVVVSAWAGFMLPSSPRQPDLRVPPALADLRPPGGPDDRAVVRVYAEHLELPLYLRAAALDHFDGLAWTRTLAAPTWPIRSDAGSSPIIIERGRTPDGWLLGVGGISGIVPLMGPFAKTDAGIRVDGSIEAVRYALVTSPPWHGAYDEAPVDARFLEVPVSVKPLALEAESLRLGSPEETIRAMVASLRRDHEYSLTPPSIDTDAPLLTFVREKRSGHCEYFASALAMWLRLDGIPSRVITGFAGGHLEEGVLVFPADSAHLWVEAFVGDRWLPVDPTPGAPFDPALALPVHLPELLTGIVPAALAPLVAEAAAVLPSQTPWILAIVLLAILGITPWILRWRSPRTVEALHASAERALRKNGWNLPRSLPPVATAEWMRSRIGDEAEPLLTLAWLHYRVRYGKEDQEPLLPMAKAAWAAARQLRPPPQ
jgi:transglutaminase-like putative cysteine protease